MLDTEQFQRISRTLPILSRADPSMRREIQQLTTFARIPAGRDVFVEGDDVEAIALLISGVVRVYKIGETGREITSTYVARNHDALKAAGAPGLWSPQDLDAALLAGTVGILITRSDTPPGPGFRLASRVRKYRIWAREGISPPPR
jgi:hypothetical protein